MIRTSDRHALPIQVEIVGRRDLDLDHQISARINFGRGNFGCARPFGMPLRSGFRYDVTANAIGKPSLARLTAD
jgi:hypothetical protein